MDEVQPPKAARPPLDLLALLLVLAGGGLLVLVATLVLLPVELLRGPVESLAGLFGDGRIENLGDLLRSAGRAAKLLALLGGALAGLGLLHYELGRRLRAAGGSGAEDPAGMDGPAPPASRRGRLLEWLPALLLLGLAGPALRQGLLWDEAWTVRTAAGSWLAVLAPDEANNHLLHTFLLKVAVFLLGAAEWVYRLPALLAGVVLVLLLYRCSRALGHREASALVAAAAGAAAFGTVFCTVNARGYSLAAAAAAALLLLRLELRAPVPRQQLVAFAAATAVAALTLPTAVIAVAAFFLSLVPWLAGSDRLPARLGALRQLIATLVATGGVVLLLYAWSLPSRLLYMAGREAYAGNFFDLLLQRMFAAWGPAPDKVWGGMLMAALFLGGLVLLGRRQPAAGIFLGALLALAILVHWRGGYSQFWYSSTGFALAPLVLGEWLDGAPRRLRLAALGAGALLVLFSARAASDLWRPRTSADAAAAFLAAELAGRDERRVAVIEPTEAMLYYLEKAGIGFTRLAAGAPEPAEVDHVLSRRPCPAAELPGWSCRDFGPAAFETVSLATRGSRSSPAIP
jgi:hypothetical protein